MTHKLESRLLGEISTTSDIQMISLVAQLVKNVPAVQETPVRFLGQEDPLEKEMATQSSVLAWRIPMDRGARWASVHGVTESDTTE